MHRSPGGNHYELLETFIDQGYIDDVLGLVKTGKEASVYCCSAGTASTPPSSSPRRSIEPGSTGSRTTPSTRSRATVNWASAAVPCVRSTSAASQIPVARCRTRRRSSRVHDAPTSTKPVQTYQAVRRRRERHPHGVPRRRGRSRAAAQSRDVGGRRRPVFRRLMDNVELRLRRTACTATSRRTTSSTGRVAEDHRLPAERRPALQQPRADLLTRDIANVCRYFESYGLNRTPTSWRTISGAGSRMASFFGVRNTWKSI